MDKIIIAFLLVVLAGCSDGNNSNNSVTDPIGENEKPGEFGYVYTGREAIQCESSGIDPDESAQTLIESGIDVLSTSCGYLPIAVPAACGYGTVEFIAHEVRLVSLPDAIELGFANTDEIDGDYELVDCITNDAAPIVSECADSGGDSVCDLND